jgi:protein-S-isoprenylcysteine O-methyltransferase Ste14
VPQDETEPLQGLNQDLAVTDVCKEKERLTFSNFVLLAATVLTVVIAALVAVLTTVGIWTVLLVAAGCLLALAVAFTALTGMREADRRAAWVHDAGPVP